VYRSKTFPSPNLQELSECGYPAVLGKKCIQYSSYLLEDKQWVKNPDEKMKVIEKNNHSKELVLKKC